MFIVEDTPNRLVTEAIILATERHRGQKRWNGDPYILHPLRVMNKMSTNMGRVVAVLHDVLEDTNITKTELAKCGFSELIIFCLDILTKKHEDWEVYIENMVSTPLVVSVKLADLEDNLNIWSLSKNPNTGMFIDEKHMKRMNKYLSTVEKLKKYYIPGY